ncbi:ribonuclease HI [Dictyocaulus viviparus]|uniref:ribonuclease H n=1 Tax=Dictyocaulus viviparus TaxID=29172 RepID=A0A0D8Y627_DICVI|nr:ribonuclease HI [Dictyocaulus viviparus]
MAGIKVGRRLDRLQLFRILSYSQGSGSIHLALSLNLVVIQTTHSRIFAGRSPPSIASSKYSYNSKSQITSPNRTLLNISNLRATTTRSDRNIPLESKSSSTRTGISSQTSESNDESSHGSYTISRSESGRTSGGISQEDDNVYENSSNSKPSNNDQTDSKGSDENSQESLYWVPMPKDRYERSSRNHKQEFSNRYGFQQSQRRSRWDEYQASKLSSTHRLQRPKSVSVEHRGDPTLIDNDKEFMKLKRNKSQQKEWNKRFPEGTIVVYTDGSCIDNRASGFGVYFGPNHELNRSEKIIGPVHNSGLAEILAAQTALQSLRDWDRYRNEPVILRTDYLPLVRAMDSGICDRFSAEMEKVRALAMEFPNGVRFQHVYAHDGDPGNEQADALARIATESARRSRSASIPRFRNSMTRSRRSRRSRSRGRIRSRSASREFNRSRSRNNDPHHIRSHSAFVLGRRR